MFFALQAHRRGSRWLAALVLATGWLAPLVPHAGGDDWACAVVGPAGDADTQIRGAASLHQPEHCEVCHAARSFRSAAAESDRVRTRLLPGLVVDIPADSPRRNSAEDRLPARAPPDIAFPVSSNC